MSGFNGAVDGGNVKQSSIVDNLTTNDATKVLSAKQGKVLQDNKVNKSDIINNLTSTATDKPLSAAQGKIINDKLSEGFDINPGSTNGGQLVQIKFVPTESDLAGKNMLLIPSTTTGISMYDNTDKVTVWAEFMSKNVTGTTSTSGNININLDSRTYIVYQVYSSTVNQICTAFRGANNSTFAHVETAAGVAVAETNVTLKVFYRKVADNLYSY